MEKSYNFLRIARSDEVSWDDVVKRLINHLVDNKAQTSKDDLEWLLLNYYALPNSPALLTAGNDKFYASACSSYPIEDSLDEGDFSILNTLNIAIKATKAGIGTGFNFSNLRSKDESVHGKNNLTGGPVSFLRAYNGFIKEITQATRKSASMGLLHISHPDIEDYINCKQKDEEIQNFNLSVVIDDTFMKAVESNNTYKLPYISTFKEKELNAKDVFNLMAMRMWENGEPGILFSDTIKRDYFEFITDSDILVNPCSEAQLSYGEDWLELCTLASINLPKYIELSLEDRKRVVSITTRLLNDIIDIQDYVSEFQENGMKYRNRKIGIGVAGLATVLAKKAIRYSSEDAYNFTKNLFKEIGDFAVIESQDLFETNIDHTGRLWVYGKTQDIVRSDSPLYKLKRYNSSLISVAPTSSLSNIFNDINTEGCSYGIEPYFTIEPYTINNSFGSFEKQEKIINIFGLDKCKELIEIANELDYKAHLNIVKAYYKANLDSKITQGCSKTINFKNNVSLDEIKEAIMFCWKNDIKAISFYRDGSRKNQVIQTKDSYKNCIDVDTEGRPLTLNYHQSPKRPELLKCDIHHVISQGEKYIIIVGIIDNKPYEVFMGLEEKISIPRKYKNGNLTKSKRGKYNLILNDNEEPWIINDIVSMFDSKEHSTLTRIISMSLRHGTPLKYVCEQLLKTGDFGAINKAIARVLKNYIIDSEISSEICPKCNINLTYISGCLTCKNCGYSKCG